MIRVLAVSALAGWATLAGAVSPLTTEESATLQSGLVTTADAFVLPAYTAQADAARELADGLAAYCAGEIDIAAVNAAFTATFLAWQRASIVQLGPIAEAEGPFRVQLWPDPKGFSRRAVRAAVAAADPALLADGGLEGRSIALTNLTALEGLVFGDLQPDTYGCALARAIGTFQADLAADLVLAWTPGSAFRDDFDTAAGGNARYASVDQLLREFLAGAVVYVDRLRKFKLLRGLGEAPGDARAERTEARLSGAGLASIEVGFRTLADVYEVPFGIFDIAPEIGGTMDYFVLGETASSIADALRVEQDSLADIAAEDSESAAELRRYADLVLYHESFLKTGFMQALGLSAGFTAADGD